MPYPSSKMLNEEHSQTFLKHTTSSKLSTYDLTEVNTGTREGWRVSVYIITLSVLEIYIILHVSPGYILLAFCRV